MLQSPHWLECSEYILSELGPNCSLMFSRKHRPHLKPAESGSLRLIPRGKPNAFYQLCCCSMLQKRMTVLGVPTPPSAGSPMVPSPKELLFLVNSSKKFAFCSIELQKKKKFPRKSKYENLRNANVRVLELKQTPHIT